MGVEARSPTADQQALLALRTLRARVDELERAAREPLAIVGMACRLPGSAEDLDAYWDALVRSHDLVSEIPGARMDVASIYDARPQIPGRSCTMRAGLLDRYSEFDADFFGISPREAITTDPQQRLLLEVSWEALEHAGIDPQGLEGSDTGVFIGISGSEYSQQMQRTAAREELKAHMLQGSALNASAGRLSYFYGLNGPSIAIDTACSSSLVAFDRACRSLREGEVGVALAGGVNFLASAASLIIASQWGMLSPSGRVRAFDAGADGFVRGEGCGVVVLKRLSDAERAGDRILAVVLGSAVNQDGASSGLTVPNGLAQQALLREAHRRAGVEPWQVGYVEAHGTGTSLGDPIEAEALGAVFAGGEKGRSAKLLLGSVKTNIGHLESAAGIAGLIKVVLALEHGMLPPQLHFEQPSEHLRWEELPLEIVTATRAWEPIAGRRIAGVSSFGFSGTNAHVVLEGWPRQAAELPETRSENVLVLSARTARALRNLARRYAAMLVESESAWTAICYTAAIGRAVFAERLAVVAASREEAAEKLRVWVENEAENERLQRGHVGAGKRVSAAAMGAVASCKEVAAAFVAGEVVDWAGRYAGLRPPRVALPSYPFERERYWMEAGTMAPVGQPGEETGRGMLGRRLRSAGVRGHFEATLDAEGWVGEHRVEGRVVLPATGHLELMLEAAAEVFGSTASVMLEDVVLEAPLVVNGKRLVQVVVEEESAGRSRVRVYAEAPEEAKWQRVSEGWLVKRLVDSSAAEAASSLDPEALRRRLPVAVAGEPFLAGLAERGLEFGPSFRGLTRGWSDEQESLGEVRRTVAGGDGWQLEPWWLDACLQVAALAGKQSGGDKLYLPLSVRRLEVRAAHEARMDMAATTWSHVVLHPIDAQTLTADITIANEHGQTIVSIDGIRFRTLQGRPAAATIHAISWHRYIEARPSASLPGHWLVLGGKGEVGNDLYEEMKRQKISVTMLATSAAGIDERAPLLPVQADLQQTRVALRSLGFQREALEGVIDVRTTDATTFADWEASDSVPDLSSAASCLSLLQALVLEEVKPKRGTWFISRDGDAPSSSGASPSAFAIKALLRTAALEFPQLAPHHVDIDPRCSAASLYRALAGVDATECAVRGEAVLVPRSEAEAGERSAAEWARNSALDAPPSGLIDDLRYREADRRAPGPDEVEIETQAAGLNFRDLMQSLQMLPASGQSLGGECAGRVVRAGARSGFQPGDRVFAFAAAGLSHFVVARGNYTRHVPAGLTAVQAAALPVVYLTALYGLHRLAGLRAGESVLIHSAAGGLGLAAVNVAREIGATVYATAGTEDRRAYLRSLGIQHVFSSRDENFAGETMARTQGRGVDVVLNALTGEFARRTLGVMVKGGRFLEAGKRDTMTPFAASEQRPDVRYLVFDLGEAADADPQLVPGLLDHLVRSLEAATLAPLPVTEFKAVPEAFHGFARARHIGKVVVVMPPQGFPLDPNGSYLVTGGFGGLGMIFAEWLVSRGARELILVGRTAAGARATQMIGGLESHGVAVHQVLADVGDRRSVEAVCRRVSEKTPLRGVIHAAGLLDDYGLLQQTATSLANVMRPKADGGWNLHRATRGLSLDFFVLCSSAAVVLGSPGQANYAAANGVLDALSVYRNSLGLAGLSVQWGPWRAAGMAEGLQVDPGTSGLRMMEPREALQCLEELLHRREPVAAVFAGKSAVAPGVSLRSAPAAAVPTRMAFLQTCPEADLRPAVMAFLQEQVFKTLDVKAHADLEVHEPFQALGLDSLMAVELRNALVAEFGVPLAATLLLDYPTLASLTDAVIKAVFSNRVTGGNIVSVGLDVLALSDTEAEALLVEELERQT